MPCAAGVEGLLADEVHQLTGLTGNDLLTGIQNGGVNVRELGESHAQPQLITRVEWYCGLALINGRAAARLAGFDATVDPS